jgi:hypothetical protein
VRLPTRPSWAVGRSVEHARPAVAVVRPPGADHGLATPPVVRVSIGRIEVRAASAPRPALPEPIKPSRPPITLAEYLARKEAR